MPIIHEAVNQNKIKIQQYIRNKVQYEEKLHRQAVRRRPATVCKCAGVLVICVATILALLFGPGILKNAQNAVRETLINWGNALYSFSPSAHASDNWTGNIFLWILGLVLFLLGFLIQLLGFVSPLLVTVVLFGLPLIIGGVAFLEIVCYDPVFHPEQVAETALQGNLPDEISIELAGIEGEKKGLEIVQALDSRCHVFTNLIVPHNGDTSELDMVVVSPQGICIVEIKGHKHRVAGDYADPSWQQQTKYTTKQFYNPVKQVGTHVYRLSHYLAKCGTHVDVKRCVLFVHDDVQLQLSDRQRISKNCPVFKGADPALFRYLQTGTPLSEQQTGAILSALELLIA